MIGFTPSDKCLHLCGNKTEYGYCKTTACINPKYNGSETYKVTVSDHTELNRDVYDGTRCEQDGEWK